MHTHIQTVTNRHTHTFHSNLHMHTHTHTPTSNIHTHKTHNGINNKNIQPQVHSQERQKTKETTSPNWVQKINNFLFNNNDLKIPNLKYHSFNSPKGERFISFCSPVTQGLGVYFEFNGRFLHIFTR